MQGWQGRIPLREASHIVETVRTQRTSVTYGKGRSDSMDEVPEALQCLRKPRSLAGRTAGEEWVADPGGQREAVETIFLGRGEETRNIQVQGGHKETGQVRLLGNRRD